MFKSDLKKEMFNSRFNNFGIENFDENRFGKMDINKPPSTLFYSIKQNIKKIIGYDKIQQKRSFDALLIKSFNELKEYEDGLEKLYANVNSESKDLIVKLIAYRLMGFSKIKLPINSPKYWEAVKLAKSLKDGNDTYDPHFMHFILEKFDLKAIGFDIKLFFNYGGIAIDFIFEQYAYKVGNITIVQADLGDTVLDIGGCWGDTALYFAAKVGEEGMVYSFEFIPDNIKVHNINTRLNPAFKKRIELIPKPVADQSGLPIYFWDNGPGSKIQLQPFEGQSGFTTTTSIDDFVIKNNLDQVDFIKMDIEGAELFALRGASETIKKFKPKLAIAIYHSMEDFINIPKWISDLDLGYELFIDHFTIHAEETICFAKPKYK